MPFDRRMSPLQSQNALYEIQRNLAKYRITKLTRRWELRYKLFREK